LRVYSLPISLWDTIGTLALPGIEVIALFPPLVRRVMGREAPRKRLACPRHVQAHGCFAEHPNVSRRSAHPLDGGERSKEAKARAQKMRRGNEVGCLKGESV